MTDAEDKTGKHGGWAAKIPLVTLLAVAVGAGTMITTQQFTSKAVGDVRAAVERVDTKLDAHIKAEGEARAVLDARIKTEEIATAVSAAVAKEGKKR